VIIWEKEAFMETSRKTINVVAALIRDSKRVFATARGYGNYKGWWEFPGGKVEHGESPEDALVREIKEELDSEISVDEYISTIEYDYPEFHLSMRCYWCSLISGDLVLKEAEDARWLDVETIDSVKWLPADITLIDEIKKRMA
jgi:8-oxo-dGTP diphosphatase